MFFTMLRKECGQYLKSPAYYIFLLCMAVDYISQMGTFEAPLKPQPDMEYIGTVRSSDEKSIMENALQEMLQDYENNSYITYPIGFYKQVILDDEEQEQVKDCILRISGVTEQELDEIYKKMKAELEEISQNAQAQGVATPMPDYDISVREDISFEEFKEELKKIDKMLGGGSSYSEKNLQFCYVPATYEQAKQEYDSILNEDRVTNAYARLFCDYMEVLLAILPVFLAVTRALQDRKAKAEQVIYMQKASSASIILSRFLAAVFVTIIPVILLSCSTLLPAVYFAKGMGVKSDLLAFVKHIGFWLLPTALVCLSVGFFLTELTDSAVAILVQGVWWFTSLNAAGNLVGHVGWNLMPRFNTVGSNWIYQQIRGQLMRNRWLYTGVALLLVFLTIIVFQQKRKGVFTGVGTMLGNRKGKQEA